MYKKSILRNNSGFTLMELLVSALAGGILILGISSFMMDQSTVMDESKRKKRSHNLAKELMADFYKDYAKNRTNSFTTKCETSEKANRFKFSFEAKKCGFTCPRGKAPIVTQSGGKGKDYPANIEAEKSLGAIGAIACVKSDDEFDTLFVYTFYDSKDKKLKKNILKRTVNTQTMNTGVEFQ